MKEIRQPDADILGEAERGSSASAYGVGYDLEETGVAGVEFPAGNKCPVAYYSYSLNKHERNFTIIEQECLAVVYAFKQLCAYVYGTKFEIVIDHASLRWLHNLKEPEGCLACWALKL